MLSMKALFAHALVLLAMVEKSPNVSSLISDYLTSGKVSLIEACTPICVAIHDYIYLTIASHRLSAQCQ